MVFGVWSLELEIGNWKLEIGNWKLVIENWQWEIDVRQTINVIRTLRMWILTMGMESGTWSVEIESLICVL